MHKALFVLCLLASCAWADPIDDLAKNLSGTHGLWKNGLSPDLGLPQGATSGDLLKKVFANGPVTSYKVVAEHPVQIDGETYQALLLDTNVGQRILLLRWEGGRWWSRAVKLPGGS